MAVTYPSRHFLITVQGNAWNAQETWQFSVRAFPTSIAPTDAAAQNVVNTLAAPTQAFFLNAASGINSAVNLTGIKCAVIETDGHYAPTHVPGQYSYAPAVPGTFAANGYPQLTMCVSLGTALPRGRGHAGRFFMPPFAKPVGADGRLTAAEADALEAAARTWLLAVNAVAEIDGVAVFSGLGAGTANFVTSVGVGRVVDTMRSRRRSLDEVRTQIPL